MQPDDTQTGEQANAPAEQSARKGEGCRSERRRLNEQLRQRLKDRRAVYLLPNMITLTSMLFGFLSMIWAGQGRISDACVAILISAIFDGLDGKVARLTHSASEFGVQFDSLADLIAFGLAPAMLMWHWHLCAFGRWGVAAAFVYAACGALRLARFNVNAATLSKRFFIGLPIPAGACTLVCFVFFASKLPDAVAFVIPGLALLVTVGTGLLMVSRIRYFSFKEYDIFRAHPYRVLISFVILLALVCSEPKIVGFIYCAAYITGGLVYTLVILPRHNSQQLLHAPCDAAETGEHKGA